MCFLLCLHLVQGSRFMVQGSSSGFAAFFYWGDARKWHLSHQSIVTPTIRGKESSHMRGMRSFGSVLTCSGWGFSHIERFRPFRMTIRGSGRVFIWEIRCVFWNYRYYITIRVAPYYENLSRVKNGAKSTPLHNPLLKTYENYVAV